MGGVKARSRRTAVVCKCVLMARVPFKREDAIALLEQIEGAIAYVDTLAPQPAARQYKKIRAAIEAAHNRLHQLMHRQGIYHRA